MNRVQGRDGHQENQHSWLSKVSKGSGKLLRRFIPFQLKIRKEYRSRHLWNTEKMDYEDWRVDRRSVRSTVERIEKGWLCTETPERKQRPPTPPAEHKDSYRAEPALKALHQTNWLDGTRLWYTAIQSKWNVYLNFLTYRLIWASFHRINKQKYLLTNNSNKKRWKNVRHYSRNNFHFMNVSFKSNDTQTLHRLTQKIFWQSIFWLIRKLLIDI